MDTLENMYAFQNEIELLRRFCLEFDITFVLIAEMKEPYATVIASEGEFDDKKAVLSTIFDVINKDEFDFDDDDEDDGDLVLV